MTSPLTPWHVYEGKLRPQFDTRIIEIRTAVAALQSQEEGAEG